MTRRHKMVEKNGQRVVCRLLVGHAILLALHNTNYWLDIWLATVNALARLPQLLNHGYDGIVAVIIGYLRCHTSYHYWSQR